MLDPFDLKTKSNKYGEKEQRRGELTFFLQPGEELENGVQDVRVLGEEEALLLKAREDYDDGTNKYIAG